jgi:BASS family bile acid:Na+ symporter
VTHCLIGSRNVVKIKPILKLANLTCLLLLYYLNAASALPGVFSSTALTMIVVVCLSACGMAIVLFVTAGLLTRGFRLERADRASLYFGIPLKNTGAAMVLTSSVFAPHAVILLTIIAYSVAQNIGVAVVDRYLIGTEMDDLETVECAQQAPITGQRRH